MKGVGDVWSKGLGVNWDESSVPFPCHFIIIANTLKLIKRCQKSNVVQITSRCMRVSFALVFSQSPKIFSMNNKTSNDFF